MGIGPVPTPSIQAISSTLTPVLPNARPKQVSTPTHEQEFSFSPDTANRSASVESTTDHDHGATSAVLHRVEDEEYTLCAYGDISLTDAIVPLPTRSDSLQPRYLQPRLRVKVRRPPMLKRRSSYIYVPDPLPHTRGMEPGSPGPFAHNSPWTPHQPLLSPLPSTSCTQRIKPAKRGDSSLERLVDELIPSSPSIRLSPLGSRASQALSLPQETDSLRHGVPSSPTPAPRQNKPQEAPWRQRLPPRLPIPEWDV